MVLLTGGSGLLGQELQKHLKCYAPTRMELNLESPIKPIEGVDLVIHSGAYTDVVKAETEQDLCYEINVNGTKRISTAYKDVPLVFISSEYAISPVNYYSQTKRLAEEYIKKNHERYLLIRCLFKPRPFPFNKAFVDQWTQGDYVDVMAKMIAEEIKNWDKTPREVHIGTGRKTIYDLALQTNPNVLPTQTSYVHGVKLQKDYV